MPCGLCQRESQIKSETDEKQYKIFVVPVPETVVDEGAVVVKILYASPAYLTVKISFSFNDFIIGAEVRKVDLLL